MEGYLTAVDSVTFFTGPGGATKNLDMYLTPVE
jgi:hypothetical protein